MKRRFGLSVALMAVVLAMGSPRFASAQEEIPPPSGKGRLVVVLSGSGGAGSIRHVAKRIAGLGYDVVLYDANALVAGRKGRTYAELMLDTIAQARQMPNALPGKVGLVVFSLGGGLGLGRGSAMSEQVAVVAAWYPTTDWMKDPAAFARTIKVPVVMFAGTDDDYKFCCMIGKARDLEKAAKAVNAPFELVVYKGAQHAFAIEGTPGYDRQTVDDAFARTAAALKLYMGN